MFVQFHVSTARCCGVSSLKISDAKSTTRRSITFTNTFVRIVSFFNCNYFSYLFFFFCQSWQMKEKHTRYMMSQTDCTIMTAESSSTTNIPTATRKFRKRRKKQRMSSTRQAHLQIQCTISETPRLIIVIFQHDDANPITRKKHCHFYSYHWSYNNTVDRRWQADIDNKLHAQQIVLPFVMFFNHLIFLTNLTYKGRRLVLSYLRCVFW